MRHAREPQIGPVEAQQLHSNYDDTFSESLKRLLDRGIVANTSANALKTQIVKLIRDYSFEIPYAQSKISDLFLKLCDLMICGELSRMRGDTFKLYLTLMIYSSGLGANGARDTHLLRELTGIPDDSSLTLALKDLEDEGYIESSINPAIAGKDSTSKRRGRGADTAMFLH